MRLTGRTRVAGFARECAVVAAGVAVYFGVRGLTEGDVSTAVAHGYRVVDLERSLGIDVEGQLQNQALASPGVTTVMNWVYIWGHWPFIAFTLVWAFWRHRPSYTLVRDAMLLSGAIGVVVFVVYPVAPPRLLDLGLTDTISEHSRSYRVLQPPAFVNQYAAVPSLHAGWDLLMGIALVRSSRTLVLRAVGVAMPVLMTTAVVLTANHYLLDVVLGFAVALTGLWLASRRSARTNAGPALQPPPPPVRLPAPRHPSDHSHARC